MLEIVCDHAHQPNRERDRRIPVLVHDAREVGVGEAP
jgi:hypothetical protein